MCRKGVGLLATQIRLKRVGSKGKPRYRVVVADSRSPRDGRFIENLGHYNPTAVPAEVKVDEERALTWLRQGAQPTETVKNLFRRLGIMEKFRQGTAAPAAPEQQEA